MTKVSMPSAHSCLPQEGHLKAAHQMFECTKSHPNLTAVFDSKLPHIDRAKFKSADWTDVHGDIKESKPCKMPPPRGNPVEISMFVDATHAGDLINCRSETGVMMFVNSAPVTWHGKRQGTAEASAFGSEFSVLCIGMEMNEGLQHKLQMMGVSVGGLSNMHCNCQSVVDNSTLPESQLKKKRLST